MCFIANAGLAAAAAPTLLILQGALCNLSEIKPSRWSLEMIPTVAATS